MEHMSNNQILQIIYKNIKIFKENLANKKILIIYGNGNNQENMESIEVFFPVQCFMHLTGVKARENANSIYSSKIFYRKMLHGEINSNNLIINNREIVQEKLTVLPHMVVLDRNAVMIGRHNNTGIVLSTDMLSGTTSYSLGKKYIQNSRAFIPNTLLNENIIQTTYPTKSIKCILKRKVQERKYANITHIQNGRNLNDIFSNLDENTRSLIDFNNLNSESNLISRKIDEYLNNN